VKSIALSVMPLGTALFWVAAMLSDPGPYDPGAVLLIGVGLLATSTVAVVGLVLVGARWARRMAYASVGSTFILATLIPLDTLWVIGALAGFATVIALASPAVTAGVRRLPSATGPPQRSVLLTLVLLGTPLALGLVSWTGANTATLVVGLSAPLTAFWYSRVLPGGLYLARYVWPAFAIGLALVQPTGAAVGSLGLGALVAGIAFHPSVKAAFYPARETGTAFAIPPELVPPEVLDEAHIDDHGRSR